VHGYASTSERLCQPVFRIFEGGTQSIHINVGVQPELFATSAQSLIGRAEAVGQLVEVLAASHGNRLKATQRLGISRSTPWRRIKAADLCSC
jgi:transcriptional regulator of acetoin/glycerol metabolism